MTEKVTNIGGRLHDTSSKHTVTGANEILDDDLQKKQSVINAEQQEFNQEQEGINADIYRKNEVYNKEETNNLISRTPETDVIVVDIPIEIKEEIDPSSTLDSKFFIQSGEIRSSNACKIKVYDAEPLKKYWFTGAFTATLDIPFVAWFDENEQLILCEAYTGSESEAVSYNDQEITAPANARYLYLNTQPYTGTGSVATYVPSSEYYDDIPSALSYLFPDESSRSNKLYRVPGPTNTTFSEWAWDGEKWVMLANKDYGIDNVPLKTSDNTVKSSGTYNAIDNVRSVVSTEEVMETLLPIDSVDNSFFMQDGSIRTNAAMKIQIYQASENMEFLVSGSLSSGVDAYFIAWFNNLNEIIYCEPYHGNAGEQETITNVRVVAPHNAAYLYLNTQPYQSAGKVIRAERKQISSFELKKYTEKASQANIDSGVVMQPQTTIQGKYIAEGIEKENGLFAYEIYEVEGNTDYIFSGKYSQGIDIAFINWFDSDRHYIWCDVLNTEGQAVTVDEMRITSPENAAYMYFNIQVANSMYYNFMASYKTPKTKIVENINSIRKSLGCPNDFMQPTQTINDKLISTAGKEIVNSYMSYNIYTVEPNKVYLFTGQKNDNFVDYNIVNWFDSNGNFIKGEVLAVVGASFYDDVKVCAPDNASYLYLNIITAYSDYYYLKNSTEIEVAKLDGEVKYNKLTSDKVTSFSDKVALKLVRNESEGFYSRGVFVTNSYTSVNVYEVEPDSVYVFSAMLPSPFDMFMVSWFDENNHYISQEPYEGTSGQTDIWTDQPVYSPKNARYLKLNLLSQYLGDYSASKVILDAVKYENIYKAVTELKKTQCSPVRTIQGFFNFDGSITSSSIFEIKVFEVTPGKDYCFSDEFAGRVNALFVGWFDSEGNKICFETYAGSYSRTIRITDQIITAPEGAAYLYLNTQISRNYWDFSEVEIEYISSSELKAGIGSSSKKSKLVITSLGESNTAFYIRSRYNSEKDIIAEYYTNGNYLISPKCVYIGLNTATDEEIMVSGNIVSSHSDSTGPIRNYTQYWHLFAQHGYPVPTISNNAGMTSADVGAEWKDQLNRHYHIGKVNSSKIWLLPVIYQDANGHYTRDWNSTHTSDSITTLTYVSGGESGHITSQVTAASYAQEQLYPIMRHNNRAFVVDGIEISQAGTYYYNDFNVSESQTGYDPATINDWFGNDGKVSLSGALPMVEFTWSYNFSGVNCGVNTTFKVLREAKGTFSATQQQFFFDKGDYKAMFIIPKAAARNGVEIDKPFNSPSEASAIYSIFRNAEGLKDVDKPVDRQIGFLHNPDTGDYLVGMAAGLSLVKGDTVTEKRNINRPLGSQLLGFSPSNTNKFYVYATDSGVFGNGYYPAGYFKEIDYYVSYFDPAENIGQVYWYKDGNRYIIYAHCQSQQSAVSINLPKEMEGLSLSVIEKTDATELLTDTILNGKFFVNYNSNEANYIVLIAE